MAYRLPEQKRYFRQYRIVSFAEQVFFLFVRKKDLPLDRHHYILIE